jgi:hypothetical protein
MTPSGGFSLTREALAQLGSAGAEASVGAAVGVTAGTGVPAGRVACGVSVGRLDTSVSDSPACTVWATAVEIVDSSPAWEPHAETSSIHPTSAARILYFPNSCIHISFLNPFMKRQYGNGLYLLAHFSSIR